ncbi:MAG TPA: TatD family hydrolase [Candidatus Eremiobacteraceae bacterium]|nr:TatD family hydrolase [Candidatus Eremiobacteraceae bacterium]
MTLDLVDTHAHLDGEAFVEDLDAVLDRAMQAGVRRIVSAGQDEATSAATIALAAAHPALAPAVGVHPHEAKNAGDLTWLAAAAQNPAVVAVGEMGLDYHYDFSERSIQRDVFARQLDLAARLDLPAIIHCREAEDDVALLLREHFDRSRRAVIHCWTGDWTSAKAFIDEFDVYLGIGGAATFKNALQLHDTIARAPLDRLVLETDCPYMTPTPFRGKRNEPAHLALTCSRVAELRGSSEAEIAAATTANAARLFPRLSPP